LGFTREIIPSYVAVKESVFPFAKFPGVDIILGPEMRSTGEVMGIGPSFSEAFNKALLAAGMRLPNKGRVFVSVRDDDKAAACEIALRLAQLGFEIVATRGTTDALCRSGVSARRINKVAEGRPHAVDMLLNREIDMVINTTAGHKTVLDSYTIRRQTLLAGIPYFTTIAEAAAAVWVIESGLNRPLAVRSLQEYHQNTRLMSLSPSMR
jgi:carbamoyl-phosphate synthase large subunit